MFLFLLSL